MKKDDRAGIPLDEVFAASEKDPGWKAGYAQADMEVRLSLQIAQARQNAGLTQGQLAKAVGTTQSVISRIEAADQNLTLATLSKIASALNVEMVVELKSSESSRTRETAALVRDRVDKHVGRKPKLGP